MKIRRRIAFHLTYQSILYALLIQAVGLLFLLYALQNYLNEEIRRNFPNGTMSAIASEIQETDGKYSAPERWTKLLKERKMWLQMVDDRGKVLFSINTEISPTLPQSYSTARLLEIQETQKIGDYAVHFQFDPALNYTRLYLIGYKNPDQASLQALFSTYQQNGLINRGQFASLEAELNKGGRYLQITSMDGTIQQEAGLKSQFPVNETPLSILAMQQYPGYSNVNVSAVRDPVHETTWILYTKKGAGDFNFKNQPLVDMLIHGLTWMTIFILIFTVAVSIWHGYRYGQPLILFVDWFQRMSQGRYDQIMNAKDKRRLYRRNGKLKVSYKLYHEVIQTFHHMAEQLTRMENERKLLEKSQEEWMAGISHDLRTPLSTIHGYGYILESNPAQWDREELQLMGSMIREKGDYMLELIEDFSLIYQLKQGASIMERSRIDLEELVRRAVLKYVNDATMSGSEFTYEGTEQPLYIIADSNWLQRLMDNLLSNAVKHNPPGVEVNVSVGWMHDRPYIKVKDNGIGMDEVTKQNLFNRYYRGTNTDTPSAGSGIGMSIAKMIVDAHGGEITVQSEAGHGTEICIVLPL